MDDITILIEERDSEESIANTTQGSTFREFGEIRKAKTV